LASDSCRPRAGGKVPPAALAAASRETSLQKRLAYLGIADFDYLSARVLLRHGLVVTGLAKVSDAFEKIMKLNLILEAKITRNEDLDPEKVKAYLHNLRALLADFEARTGGLPPDLLGSFG
jgi:hypothetical protein